MSTARPFAYNTGSTIFDTDQIGDLAIGGNALPYSENYGGVRWWNGPDEDLGYCIGYDQPANTQPTPNSGETASVQFWRSEFLTEESFVELANYIASGAQVFSTGMEAKSWLNLNGYWTSFVATKYKVLSWDIQNNSSYGGSGNVITDLLGNVNGGLIGSIPYTSGSPKYLTVNGGSSTYISTSSSLNPYLTNTEFSTLLWVYPTANGIILDEIGAATIPTTWHDAQIQMVGGTLRFDTWSYNTFSFNGITSSISTPFNNWYYIAMTYDGVTLRAYVNGQFAGSMSKSRVSPAQNGFGQYYALGPTDTTNLSGSNPGGVGGQFRFGSFEVYNYGITGAQVLTRFNATKSSYGL